MSTTKSLSLRETADTTRRVSAPPAASLNDPSGLKIDSSECDADKECAKWKANYLKHREARAQYEALDKNTNLLVKLKWDPKASESVTNGYKWNASGELTNATVTLAAKTGWLCVWLKN
jgi:ferric-dicitrate binding protein FerR (iron transport regulator)